MPSKNIEVMSGPELVAYYNELTGESVKRFATRAAGLERVQKAELKKYVNPIEAVAPQPAPVNGLPKPSPSPAPAPNGPSPAPGWPAPAERELGAPTGIAINDSKIKILPTSKSGSPTVAAIHEDRVGSPAAVVLDEPGARARIAAEDARVVKTIAPNPKRVGSAAHKNYDAYRVGMTVGALRAAGVPAADIRWNEARGFVTFG